MKYFLIGRPLSHSFSAAYFNRKFSELGIDSHYDLCPLERIEELPALIDSYGEELRGFNITAPYKQEVIKYMTTLTPEATRAGSVNCVRRESDGSLTGHNTDVEGFIELLKENLPWPIEGRRALVIGGGGVVGAVLAAFESLGIDACVAMRDPSKFADAHPQFKLLLLELSKLTKEDILGVDIIVNCTPLGTAPNVKTAPAIPYEYIQKRHLCLDLVYNPEQTTFSRICAAHGATAATGMKMLTAQAEAGWKFWNQ